VYLEPQALNSKFPTWYEFAAGDAVLHLAGVHDELREAMFHTAWGSVCQSLADADADADELVSANGIATSTVIYEPQLSLGGEQQRMLLRRVRLDIVHSALDLAGLGEAEAEAQAEAQAEAGGQPVVQLVFVDGLCAAGYLPETLLPNYQVRLCVCVCVCV
jgi:hypothetical protein